jgi:hypothetical protein
MYTRLTYIMNVHKHNIYYVCTNMDKTIDQISFIKKLKHPSYVEMWYCLIQYPNKSKLKDCSKRFRYLPVWEVDLSCRCWRAGRRIRETYTEEQGTLDSAAAEILTTKIIKYASNNFYDIGYIGVIIDGQSFFKCINF